MSTIATGGRTFEPPQVSEASPPEVDIRTLTPKSGVITLSQIYVPTPAPTKPPTNAPVPTLSPSITPTSKMDTCAVPERNLYWDKTEFPEFGNKKRCTMSEDCAGMTGSCCLIEFCLCGRYIPGEKEDACFPTIEDRTDGSNQTQGVPSSTKQPTVITAALTPAPFSPRPTLAPVTPSPTQVPTTKKPTLSPTPVPTSQSPTTATPTTEQPTSPAPTSIPTSVLPTVPQPVPELNSCSSREVIPFWDVVQYPEYEETIRCWFSEECIEDPNACCLARTCLCGTYNDKAGECIPSIASKRLSTSSQQYPQQQRSSDATTSSTSGPVVP